MDAFLHACVAGANDLGRGFCAHAAGMFVQSGVLIAVLLCVDLLLRSRLRATLRYWIWMLVIVKLLLPPAFSLPTGVGHWLGEYAALPAPVAQQVLETPGPPESPGQAVSPKAPIPPSNAGVAAARTDPVESAAGPGERLTWQGAAVLLWGVGVLAFALLVIRRVLFVRRLVAQGHPAHGAPAALLEECRRRMNIRRPVGMKLLSGSFSPAVCGLRRPTILLPQTLPARLAPENLRAVLIHELAHIKRADLWVNCVQTILQVIYFYNPLVWLANAIVRRVREQAVDEMSLVALGAEARSYGDTLIDVAEMALGRGNPAVRLVGVAESKRSLEGRIRHMITRPMPKSARMGVARGLVVAALGAVLLPMAAAGTRMIGRPSFTAALPNGVTVELVGVCNWPAGAPVCWRADGSPLEKPLHVTNWRTRPGANHYGFMVRIAGPNDLNRSWNRIEGSDGWEAGCDVVDAQGHRLEGYTAAVALMKEGATQTALQLGFATGPWSTISTRRGEEMSSRQHTDVLWSQMFQDPRGTFVVATAEWRRDRTRRIIAIDAEGAVHVGQGGSVATGTMDQATYYFPRLRPNQIRELQYQVRPFEWVEFEGISLVPGRKSTVTITAGSLKEKTPRVGAAVSGLDPATARREYSRTLLTNLGKAVLLYAQDHAGKLPDGIEDVRERFNGVEVERLLEKAVYLGQGLSATGSPTRIIAYDKTLLAEGWGTNVLYLDFRVVFETPERLKELGIPTAAGAVSPPSAVRAGTSTLRDRRDQPPRPEDQLRP